MKLDTVKYSDDTQYVIETHKLQSWASFKKDIGDYVRLSRDERKITVFRGQGNAKWALETTLDRTRSFGSNAERLRFQNELINDFKKESQLVSLNESLDYDDNGWLYLARHHGLPTPVLDWSASPYVAAFFAFANLDPRATHVAIWSLNRDVFLEREVDIELDDTLDSVRQNARALSQRGLFMKISSHTARPEEVIPQGLSRWTLQTKWRNEALNDLDEMGINERNLLMNLDSAAKTVCVRAGIA